jgi:acetylornithine deacetylase/succinyl-diaminopimelate desuccinylase-like protein
VAGERTGEKGDELIGEVCAENRGVVRFRLVASGKSGHSGTSKAQPDMTLGLVMAVDTLSQMVHARLTTSDPKGWVSGVRFSFFNVGQPGVYNITPTRGEVGVEIRPIPEDNIDRLVEDIRLYAEGAGLELVMEVHEAGIACAPDNPHLLNVLASVREATGLEPVVGKKLPGTSARFAPGGQAIVWGQSGIGPHALDERHYIPSIKPYYDSLAALAEKYKGAEAGAAAPKKQKAKAR